MNPPPRTVFRQVRGGAVHGIIARVKHPPEEDSLAVAIWPRALPLAEIFGAGWASGEIRGRFLTLAAQWHARHPTPEAYGGLNASSPGQWRWHPPAHRVYDCHTYDGLGDDWMEVLIRIEADDYLLAHYRVGARLSIACRCDLPHAQHTIVEVSWRSGGAGAALDAFTAVLRCTDQWLADSRQPEWWRRHAGLG